MSDLPCEDQVEPLEGNLTEVGCPPSAGALSFTTQLSALGFQLPHSRNSGCPAALRSWFPGRLLLQQVLIRCTCPPVSQI